MITKNNKENTKEKSLIGRNKQDELLSKSSNNSKIQNNMIPRERYNKKDDYEEYFLNNEDNCDDDSLNSKYPEDDSCEDKQFRKRKSEEDKDLHPKEKIIKSQLVVAKRYVRKVGELEVDAPIGVGIDKTTGNLTTPVKLEPFGEIVFKPRIIRNLLINEGYIPARIIVEDNDPEPCPRLDKGFMKLVFIPFQSEISIKGIQPDDNVQEKFKIKSMLVFGFPNTSPLEGKGTITKLVLKVILKVKIIVSRDCLLAVPARIIDCD